ncbi:hypothetical protein E2C01_085101 [Portunus trituberculatus]|uniref:Uncharacterized protein n=1 Tax=Portunus trituberculatus TaxID=210409 RepID=A0A5B7IX17_PORTR|nr:hypothetical protein [Portunus trituberculatus]
MLPQLCQASSHSKTKRTHVVRCHVNKKKHIWTHLNQISPLMGHMPPRLSPAASLSQPLVYVYNARRFLPASLSGE